MSGFDDKQREIHRSTSMPVRPKHLEPKPLVRSPEKEEIRDEDIYQENSDDLRQIRNIKALKTLSSQSEQMFVDSLNDPSFTDSSSNWDDNSSLNDLSDVRAPAEDVHMAVKQQLKGRVIDKSGHENISFKSIPQKSWRYMRDIVTTLVRPLLRFLAKRHESIMESKQSITTSSFDHSTIDRLETSEEKSTNETTKEPVKFSL